jgi:hypothetical protein
MTTLMQAHRQWMSRAPDERFTSLIDMQAFKRRVRDNSRSHVLSSRKVNLLPVEDDPRALQVLGGAFPAAAPTHWSFGQLCSLASPGNSPASYFRETNMPAPMIADCLNYNAGTVMHRSHLRLTKWFSAAHLLATQDGKVSVRQLQSRLRVAYQTASMLKRKLQLTKFPADREPLQGRVEFASKAYNRVLGRMMPQKLIVVVALELPDDEPPKPSSPARGFNRIRLAAVLNSSPASIEPFIFDNVQRGAILLTEDPYPFLGFFSHGYDLREFGETLSHSQHVFSRFEHWLSEQGAPTSDQVETWLRAFVIETKWRVSFDKILELALEQEPVSYWDIVGHQNPRKGAETVRRRPRHRKTATGMREDGSGAHVSFPPELMPGC